MVWKLCIAVLALQMSCLLADDSNMLADLLMRAMSRQQEGGDQGESYDDPSELLMAYMKTHDISVDQNPSVRFLQKIIEMSEGEVTYYHVLQSFDLVTKSILHDVITNEDGVNDFAKHLLMKKIKESVPRAGDLKDVMGMLFDYLLMNPKTESREMIMQLLYHVTSQQSKEDRGVLRVMMLHLIEKTYGDQKQLVQELFAAMMSEELGGGDMEPREMLMLFVQHLMDQIPYDSDKKAMGQMLMHGLSERMDTQGKTMLREFITKVILIGSQPQDIEEDDYWKYHSPGPCLVVERDTNVEVHKRECPMDFPCDVVTTYNFDGKDMNYHMCRYSAEYLEYFAFHSCEVTYPGGVTEKRSHCATPGSKCDLSFFTDVGDDTYGATFCSDYANYSAGMDFNPLVYRACALIDSASDLRVVQRKCPSGQVCNSKPQWVTINGYPLKAMVCQPNYEENDLMLKLLNGLLGYEEEEEEDAQDMMGGGRVANMTAEYSVSDFVNYVVMQLYNHMQENQGKDDMKINEDEMAYKVLKYLIEKVAGNDPLLERFLRNLETRHYLGIITNADRVMVHGTVANLMVEFYHMQKEEDNQEGRAAVAGLMSLLHAHAADHMKINKVIEEHREEHAEADNLNNILRKILGHEDSSEEEDDHEDSEAEIIRRLLERMGEMSRGDK